MPCGISRKKRFSAATIIAGNDDLLTQILVLLPVKSVVRFESVNKQWQSLISSESFARLHIQNHVRHRAEPQHSFILGDVYGRPQFFICHPTIKKLTRVSLPGPLKHFEYVKILQSMNGLLLLSLKSKTTDRIDYVVFNPITMQYRYIHLDGCFPRDVILVYDPSKSEYYKLIMTSNDIPSFSLYDSATHLWSHGIESLYALGFSISDVHPNSPQVPVRGAYHACFSDSDGNLNILQVKPSQKEDKIFLRVAVSIDYEWFIYKQATLDFESFECKLLGMIREERIEDSSFLFHVPGRLLIYRFCDDDLKVIVDYRSDYFYVEGQLQFQYAHPFIHTFASV